MDTNIPTPKTDAYVAGRRLLNCHVFEDDIEMMKSLERGDHFPAIDKEPFIIRDVKYCNEEGDSVYADCVTLEEYRAAKGMGESARADQLSLNLDWLLARMDAAHRYLCKGKRGTWKQRADQLVEACTPQTPEHGDTHWTYTTKCARCHALIDYCVDKKNMNYEAFYRATVSAPLHGYRSCETCDRMTLQTLVSLDRKPEEEQ
jgi:hypothetical protein